jgi:hypothetical protein
LVFICLLSIVDKSYPDTLHSKTTSLKSGAFVPLFVFAFVYIFALGSTEPTTANTYVQVFWDVCPKMQAMPMPTMATCISVLPCASVTVTKTATITATVTSAASAIASITTSVTAVQSFANAGFFSVLGGIPLYFSILAGAKAFGVTLISSHALFSVFLAVSSAVFLGMASSYATVATNLAWGIA